MFKLIYASPKVLVSGNEIDKYKFSSMIELNVGLYVAQTLKFIRKCFHRTGTKLK